MCPRDENIHACSLDPTSLTVSGYAISQGSIITQLNTTKLLAILGITAFTITFGVSEFEDKEEAGADVGTGCTAAAGAAIRGVRAQWHLPHLSRRVRHSLHPARTRSKYHDHSRYSLPLVSLPPEVPGQLADGYLQWYRGIDSSQLGRWDAGGRLDGCREGTADGPLCLCSVCVHRTWPNNVWIRVSMSMYRHEEELMITLRSEEKYDFRVVVWIMLAMSTTFAVSLLFILRETRASVLLSRRAAKLRKETGDERYQSRDDFERGSFIIMMKTSLGRPIRMLYTEPVLLAFAIWYVPSFTPNFETNSFCRISFCWGVLYILLESLPLVFGGVYGFSIGQSGLTFITQIVGSCIGLGESRPLRPPSTSTNNSSSCGLLLQHRLPQERRETRTRGEAVHRNGRRYPPPRRILDLRMDQLLLRPLDLPLYRYLHPM